MIHEILSSDVEFARGMLNAHHSDAEVLTSLSARGVEAAKAAQLLDDLRHGREPSIHVPFALASTARPGAREPATTAKDAPPAAASPPPHSSYRPHRRSGVSWWFVVLLGLFLWALWYAWFKSGGDTSQDAINFDKHRIPDAPTKEAPR
jgi:hypothetical protein